MRVQVELDETCTRKIGKERPIGHGQDSRELRKRHGLDSTNEVEGRTPLSGDLAKREARHGCGRQLNLTGPCGSRIRWRDSAPRAVPEFRGDVNPVNPRVSDYFSGKLIRSPSVPKGPADVTFAHWNRPAMQLDHEHRPLILMQATDICEFIVLEMSNRSAITSGCSGGQRQSLPRMSDVVQAVSISPVTVLPRLAPGNAG